MISSDELTKVFAPFTPESDWLECYLEFMKTAPAHRGVFDRHHILPRSLFPEYVSFRANPWNRVDLRPFDHLIAHYYLFRALPSNRYVRCAFHLMVGRFYAKLIDNYGENEEIIRDIAAEYEQVRVSGNVSSIKGWVRIHKDSKRPKAVPAEQLAGYLSRGWTTEAPKREWMWKGLVSKRVLLTDVDAYIADGFTLGRPLLSEETKKKMSQAVQRSLERDPELYSRNKLSGIRHPLFGKPLSEEHRARIAASSAGIKKSMESVAKRREAMLGKHWAWAEEKKAAHAIRMTGPGNNRYGLPGYWADKTRSKETKAKMSETHQKNLVERPEIYNQNKPCGADHWTFGVERPQETRDKIAASLTGKVQSAETKKKRAESLALAKMPTFLPEDEAKFHALLLAPDEGRAAILKTIKGNKPRDLAKGILIILEGRQAEEKRRYWRMSETWIKQRAAAVPLAA